ncbi:rhamnose ABC transporter, periplasmic rhamnose-binding protein [Caldicellulosiruptor hydrothermalis 108]|uniref:Rhamnose ABC transporter, periplasmic rhamnose-binding protein n=1 Tax=Caldicellulosiruptor hydrothermalis (strain DSM 18901 / VKM B-2411 / 108) TaxID=632292 RepID=E4QDB1_CALH1|nr:rhamnose ABC transporter substrate-binding protein [Caldicellulosiruptor hydrothermalis]ADQ06406.1 rhamnose ABC transporter, periplasmic rhamnose-binding protein [Caldicellulosiruptor hydrothermalis 108]
MRKSKKLVSIVLVCVLVLSLVLVSIPFVNKIDTFGAKSFAAQKSTRKASAGKKRIAIIVKNAGNPYNEKEAEGFSKALKELGDTVIVQAPAQPTAEAQIQIIQQLIAQRVDCIAIAANDPDALQPALQKAMKSGIKVLSLDSAVNPKSRMVHVNQADPELIGRTLIQAMYQMIGGKGEFAILSATSQATNQNTWIKWMKEELKNPKYKNMKLVKIAYGDDLRDKSVSETEGLLKSFPNLKGIIAPTTVGMAAAGKVLTDKGLKGKVKLTGLGLPSEMAEYIKNGVCPWMYLWNPIDLGYLAGYVADALARGKITGKLGEKLKAGRLGEKQVVKALDGGTEIRLGAPFKFDKSNIDYWAKVY